MYFREKIEEGVRYFQNHYLELQGFQILEILQVVEKFPKIVNGEMNPRLYVAIMEQEIWAFISSMQWGEIPSSNGFPKGILYGFLLIVKGGPHQGSSRIPSLM